MSDGRGKAIARPSGTRADEAGRRGRLAPAGLTPTNENIETARRPPQRGSDLAQSEWILEFTVRLTEAGFSDVQVARILEAAERAAVELST
jgi:hypothetical protein